jgi:hypothetical protein
MNYLKSIWIAISLICFSLNVNATHLVGSEIGYRHLGNQNYEITVKIYRDCAGIPFDDTSYVAVYNSSNQLISNLHIFINSRSTIIDTSNSCSSQPAGICYELGKYIDTVQLPISSGGYTIVYQRCCRPGYLLNIGDPGLVGTTIYTTISEGTYSSNSTPGTSNPPIFMCVGIPFMNDQSVTDLDNDSIVYSLYTPFMGADPNNPYLDPPLPGPYNPVYWMPPYSLANPLGGVPLSIDPNTGILTAIPNTLGAFVYGIKVEEYRNTTKISETLRDFMVNVVNPVSVSDIKDHQLKIEVLTESNSSWTVKINDDSFASLRIYDVLGKVVKQEVFNSGSINIDHSSFGAGLYIFDVNIGGNHFVEKVSKF